MNATIHNASPVLKCLLLAGFTLIASCKKGILDEKPRTDILIPTTLADCKALLENNTVMNETPELGEISADNYYLTYNFWLQLSQPQEKNGYIWAEDIYADRGNIEDWNKPFTQVLYTNIILECLDNIKVDNSNRGEWNEVRGSALFFRAYAFYNLSQIFAETYDSTKAASALGLPLRLRASISDKVSRSSLQDTYKLILNDLLDAKDLLSSNFPLLNRNRPHKNSAMALLARIYLSIRDYKKAGDFADSVLKTHNYLTDYNNLSVSSNIPFRGDSAEILFQSRVLSSTGVLSGIIYPDCIVDSALYRSYNNDDLRKILFYTTGFTGNINLKGTYTGSFLLFSGLATDELYLIRAECNARAGKTTEAITDLNTLLVKRWRKNTFIPFNPATSIEALDIILQERRKELAFRGGLRWSDLRRFNKEGRGIQLARKLNGKDYTLEINSPFYVLPIPPDAVRLGELQQNER